MVDMTVALKGANGDTITLDGNDSYILTKGVRGFGIPVTSVRIADSAGDGGVWRNTKRGIRELDLPITIIGTDRQDTEDKLRRLALLLQDSDGPTQIIASYSNGKQFVLEAHYTGGAETQFGDDANDTHVNWFITMQAPAPYWTSSVAQTFTVGTGNTGRGLLPALTKMRLTSSQTLGTITVNNTDGDVPSYPIWTIYGPVTGLQIQNSGTGQGFTYSVPLTAGQTLTIDTGAGTIVDQTGVNKYSSLGYAPKLFALPPGTTKIAVVGTAADANTKISCTYYPRREVLH